ncbi:hypothetical protein QFC19_005814 [Naganishia cerealis]|uniref:Uncharacterized protein n=1 Tax=Naganishia cerealis TaxID=610337 RepID=A0ACC2VL37_9TREE|nr:hypothetical protein QFC19_005814 [Naganishia cerealis]
MDQLSPSIHLLTVAAFAIARYLISYFGLNRDIALPPVPHERHLSGVAEIVLFNLDFGFKVSATIFQINMNRKCPHLLVDITVVGKRNPTYSFNAMDCLTAVIELYTTYQAFTLPSVKQGPVEEEEE